MEDYRGLSLSNLACLLVTETNCNVIVLTGEPEKQMEGIKQLYKSKPNQKYVKFDITSKDVNLSVVTKGSSASEKDTIEENLQIVFAKSAFEWPDKVGLADLQNVSDLSDFHIVFPFDAWMRGACRDAMACMIG